MFDALREKTVGDIQADATGASITEYLRRADERTASHRSSTISISRPLTSPATKANPVSLPLATSRFLLRTAYSAAPTALATASIFFSAPASGATSISAFCWNLRCKVALCSRQVSCEIATKLSIAAAAASLCGSSTFTLSNCSVLSWLAKTFSAKLSPAAIWRSCRAHGNQGSSRWLTSTSV